MIQCEVVCFDKNNVKFITLSPDVPTPEKVAVVAPLAIVPTSEYDSAF